MTNELVQTNLGRNICTFVPILKNIGQTLRPLELKKCSGGPESELISWSRVTLNIMMIVIGKAQIFYEISLK